MDKPQPEQEGSEFAKRLKAERVRLDMSAEAMAVVGKVSRTSQFAYENGSQSPDAAYLLRVRERGVDAHYVLTGVRENSAELPERTRTLVDRFSVLPVEIQRTVEDVVLLSYLAASARVDYHRCSPTPGASDDTGAYRVDPPRPAVALHEPAPSTPKPKRPPR